MGRVLSVGSSVKTAAGANRRPVPTLVASLAKPQSNDDEKGLTEACDRLRRENVIVARAGPCDALLYFQVAQVLQSCSSYDDLAPFGCGSGRRQIVPSSPAKGHDISASLGRYS